ncbi:MAG: ATP-binding protein [Thermoanaerobaculia bacterium]
MAFGVFVLADIGLFSWLIFRSLSQREVDRVLLETREEARNLAQRIAARAGADDPTSKDILLVILHETAIQREIDDNVAKRDVIQMVEIQNTDGNVIYRSKPISEAEPQVVSPDSIERQGRSPTPGSDPLDVSSDGNLVISEAIGKLGQLQIGLSPARMRERAEALRQDLMRQTLRIAAVSLLVLASLYAVIGILLRRTRRLQEKAEEADRLAYVGTLAAGLAHEIRSPLNSLNLNLQMLEEDLSPSQKVGANQRLFSITRQELRRLERLVTDFLAYARPRRPERVEIAPVELLERVRDVLAGELRARGARVRVEDRSGGALIKVDVEQMTQLLLNLVTNGLAATEETGRAPEIVLRAASKAGQVQLSVGDNGAGIAGRDLGKIFEVFYSTRKGGTGLGLAVVQRIAQSHGAELDVESRVGEGTTVTVTLPVA